MPDAEADAGAAINQVAYRAFAALLTLLVMSLSSRGFVCFCCQFESIFSPSLPRVRQWQPRRNMAMAMGQRKKPSRMSLSKDVARLPSAAGSGMKRAPSDPFGGMNQTEARIGGRSLPRPRAELRRRSSVRQEKVATAQRSVEQPESHTVKKLAKSAKADKDKDVRPLFHALKMQATLTPLSYNQRTILKEKLAKIESFEQFGLRPDVNSAIYSQALPGMTDLVPTPVQKLAIPALLSKKGQFQKMKKDDSEPKFDQFLLAAETGSGKTLAYLLPILDAIKTQEELDKIELAEREAQKEKEREERRSKNEFELDPPELSNSPHSTTGRPRAIILLPSSELVTQVGGLVKLLSHTIKYRSAPISASHSATVIRNRLFNPNGIDIVVSTPHLISSIAEKEPHVLSRVQHLVIDEADSLLDRSFSSITCGIIDRVAPSLKQLILCSATIPRSLDSFLDKRFPQITRLVTPKLHSIPRRVQLGVVDIDKAPYQGNRNLACADIIWSVGKATHDDTEATHTIKSMIVFVNERDKAEEVAKFLSSKGIEAVPLTRDTPEQRQSEILSAFTSASRIEGDVKEPASDRKRHFRDFIPFDKEPTDLSSSGSSHRRLPNTKVLVTTDLGSRGIDTLAVRHVILYDVPHTTIDFVHRLGRTGRMGRRGRGIVLVGKHDRKDVVREVKEAMFKGQALI
jgi:ATP-dependent RNA helicase MRH4